MYEVIIPANDLSKSRVYAELSLQRPAVLCLRLSFSSKIGVFWLRRAVPSNSRGQLLPNAVDYETRQPVNSMS